MTAAQQLETEVRKLQNSLRSTVFRTGQLGDNGEQLNTFLRKTLTLWTLEPKFGEIAGLRRYLKLNILRPLGKAPQQEAFQAAVNSLLPVLESMSKRKDYALVTRFNAMSMLADLNQVENVDTLGRGTIVPLPAAFPVLLAAFQADEADMPDAVRVAALQGLQRHAGGTGFNQQDQLRPIVLAELKKKTVPSTRSREAHDWVRMLLVRTLAAMEQVGDQSEVVQALLTVVEDAEGESLGLRCEAARAFSTLDFSNQQNTDFARIAKSLGQLALEIMQRQDTSQRRRRALLDDVRTGLAGPAVDDRGAALPITGLSKAATGSSHKPFVDGLIEKFDVVQRTYAEKFETPELFEAKFAENAQAFAAYLSQEAAVTQATP